MTSILPLPSTFCWSFPEELGWEPEQGGEEVAQFDTSAFSAALSSYVNAAARHSEALGAKGAMEKSAQLLYDRLFKVNISLAHLEGRCKCGHLVKADVDRSDAVLDEAMSDKVRQEMETIFLHNTSEVFLSLYAFLVAELTLVSAMAPLARNLSEPSACVTPFRTLLLQLLNVITELLRSEPSCIGAGDSCRQLVLLMAGAAHRLLRHVGGGKVTEPVRRLWTTFSSWEAVARALQSPSTLDAEAVQIAHSYLLLSFKKLGPSGSWAADLLVPDAPEIRNNWLAEALTPPLPEASLLAIIARVPWSQILAQLDAETVQSRILVPVQQALEVYAPQTYLRLAVALARVLLRVARSHPELFSKCLAILTQSPDPFQSVCSAFLGRLPWSVAPEHDIEALVSSLLLLLPDMAATDYLAMSHVERAPHRVKLVSHMADLRQNMLVMGMDQNANGSPLGPRDLDIDGEDGSNGIHGEGFPVLDALAAIGARLSSDSPLARLILEEIMFFCLYRFTPPLNHAALAKLQAVGSRVSVNFLGSTLVDLCISNFPQIDAENIALVMGVEVFRAWVPTARDLEHLAFITDHRRLSGTEAVDGVALVDLYIERLFLGGPTVSLPEEIRGIATRNGGQIIMGVYWTNAPYQTQIRAAFLLISSRYVGMPSDWVLDTLLSEKMAIFDDDPSIQQRTDTTTVSEFSSSDLAAAERILHISCPHPTIQLEWRVLKILIALHLCLLHCHEIQSFSGSGVFAKFNRSWLESLGIFDKIRGVISDVDNFVAVRLMERLVRIMVSGGKSFFRNGIVAPLFETLLSVPEILAPAARWLYTPTVARAVADGSLLDDEDPENPSLLATTLQFFADSLWPLVERKQLKSAMNLFDSLLHSAFAAASKRRACFYWPHLEAASVDLAASFARSDKVFLAVCTVRSVRPLEVALDGAIELAINVIHEKDLALVCWDAVFSIVSEMGGTGEKIISLAMADRAASACRLFEKQFPLGNPARKAYVLLAESLRRSRGVPETSVLGDSSLRRYLWGRFEPLFRVAPGTGSTLSSSAESFRDRRTTVRALDSSTSVSNVRRFDLSLVISRLCFPPFFVLHSSMIDFSSAACHKISVLMSEMEELEKDFLEACRSMYVTVAQMHSATCGSSCMGGAELRYTTTIQTPESLAEPIANRKRFAKVSMNLWLETAKAALGAFVLTRATAEPNTADAVLQQIVAFSAERLYPDAHSLETAGAAAIRALGGPSVDTSISLFRAFFQGCRRRFILEQGTGFFPFELQDNSFDRISFVLPFLVAAEQWSPTALLKVLQAAFENVDTLTLSEFRRIMNVLRLDEALPRMVENDECIEPLLGLSCRFFALPDFSAPFFAALLKRSIVEAVRVAVTAAECWANGSAKELEFQRWKVQLLPIHIPSGAPVWKFGSLGISSAQPPLSHKDASSLLLLLGRALALRRKPPGLVGTIRKWLPELLAISSWAELEHVVRACAVSGEGPLCDTASVICQCAPSIHVAFAAWISWLSQQACTLLHEKEAAFRVLNVFAPLFGKVAWCKLKPIPLFLREVGKTAAGSLRREVLFHTLTLFAEPEEGYRLEGANQVVPAVLLSCFRSYWDPSLLEQGIAFVRNHCDFTSVQGLPGEEFHLPAEVLSQFVASLPTRADDLLSLLEAVRVGCEKSPSSSFQLYWMRCCRFQTSVGSVLHVLAPLCRRIANEEACKVLLSVCASSPNSVDLVPVLRTFVASLNDEDLCLTVLHVIPSVIRNPLLSAPLIEALLHAYLSVSARPAPLEAAAVQYSPASLPSDAKHEFPIHDVAACQSSGGLALTLMLILERQRIVSANDNPASWCECFACPALASLHSVQADPVRPFDLVGLWCWAIQAVVMPFRRNLHKELSRVLIDFVQVLDDIFSGYSAGAPLPSFLKDRMELAAGTCACLAVRQSVLSIKGDMVAAGVIERRNQLIARARKIPGCDLFIKELEKLPDIPLSEICRAFFTVLFPMAPYLACIVQAAPVVVGVPPLRSSQQSQQASGTSSGSVQPTAERQSPRRRAPSPPSSPRRKPEEQRVPEVKEKEEEEEAEEEDATTKDDTNS